MAMLFFRIHILKGNLSPYPLIVEAHIEQAALSGFEQGGCKVLTRLRERFRKKLTTAKLAPSIGSSDAMFGWLQQALAKLIALKPHDGRAHFIALFRLYTVQVKKCAGCPAAPRAHWEVSHPLWRAPFQLSPEMHRLFGGDLSRWFRWMLDPSEWEKAACWWQSDANPFCNGAALAKEYILNIPAILVFELGDTLRSSWKVPVTLLPLGQKFSAKGVKYTLVAQIYTNWTLKRGSSSHFIARYVTSDGAMIFDYDGMEHHGHAKHRLGAKTAGWMSGPSNKLKDLPSGYTLTALVYHLDGGLDAQQLFASERRRVAPWGLQLDADSNQQFARLARLVQPHLKEMKAGERKEWANKKRQAQAREYQMEHPESPDVWQNDKATDTTRFQGDLVPQLIQDSESDIDDPPPGKDAIDNLIAETLESAAPTRAKHGRDTSLTSTESTNSTNSPTPCPINCFGCGEVSGGDDGPNQIFDTAVGPLAKLLVEFPDEHPAVSSYMLFFADQPDEWEERHIENWSPKRLTDPHHELVALMAEPLTQLQDFKIVAVPGRERRRRVLTVGRAMLQLLAIQHELGEPLNLNGDMFEDIVDGSIEAIDSEHYAARRTMLIGTKPKVLSHNKHWNLQRFVDYAEDVINNHIILDPDYRPALHRRVDPPESRRPPITLIVAATSSRDEFPAKTRRRSNSDDEDSDTPPPERQETSRLLRPRRGQRLQKAIVPTVPVDKVVASGKGWVTDDMGSD
ncbi:hypothetical protein C8R46DRAFT_1235681 [Mycena filopes]|nr:hypothetical protein C8R46DRAFT_1235681 [Mycena filopes]